MKFTAFHPFVLPWVRHLPDETIAHHVRQAAIAFCARTGVWHEELPPILTLATIGTYEAPVDADAKLAKLWTCFVGDTEYAIASGMNARTSARRGGTAPTAYTDRDIIILTPAPASAGLAIVVEAALKPTIDCTELPDLLDEHIEDISFGALASLFLLPSESQDANQASAQRAMFERRISVVGARVSRGFSSVRIRPTGDRFC